MWTTGADTARAQLT